jgi:hypothetical protein
MGVIPDATIAQSVFLLDALSRMAKQERFSSQHGLSDGLSKAALRGPT